MEKQPFSPPGLLCSDMGAGVSPITVFLCGEIETEGRAGCCVVRSVVPGRVLLETDIPLEQGDPVRISLRGDRGLWGEVEDGERGLTAVRFRRMPEWVLGLCAPRSAH